ncbi:LysM peptidoglycan-binding domain-containing protein [Deinococcus oregonensis]|uniref:LysM peptidoglycan-binding domain-containing protein n=1 Tax=Deinococcus oregonensis TaxID=1805970 RepID=A0ABV6AZ68_9DEIO
MKSGDTLFKIATRQGLSVARLKTLNGLTTDTIRVGQVLRLNGNAAPAVRASSPTNAGQGVYTVKSGDFLSKIAASYGVSVGSIQVLNGLRGSVITPGQRLRLPTRGTGIGSHAAAAARPAPVPRPTTEVRIIYTYVRVALRETADSLAVRYRTTRPALMKLNRLNANTSLMPGQKLLVPQRVPVPIPPAARGAAVTFKRFKPLNIPVQVFRVDLRHRDVLVAPVLPRAGLGYGARVGTLAQQSGARAVINGSYFHPQTYAPAGDLVMQGRLLTWGRIPAALAITPDNRAAFAVTTTGLLGRPLDSTWNGMETVIATGPRILLGGRVQTRYNVAFRDPALFGRAARSAVGLSSNRDLVFVSTHSRLTTTEMGKVMARLGVRDALLLDGGSSTGVAWNGTAILDSTRKVSYGIGVFTDYTGRRYAR